MFKVCLTILRRYTLKGKPLAENEKNGDGKMYLNVTVVVFNTGASRSSRSQMCFKIGALKNFARFTGKYPCWSLF